MNNVIDSTSTEAVIVPMHKRTITASDIRLAAANGDHALLGEVARRVEAGNPTPKVSFKDRLAGVGSKIVVPAMVAAKVTVAAKDAIVEEVDERLAVRASRQAYRESVIIPEGRAIRLGNRLEKIANKLQQPES